MSKSTQIAKMKKIAQLSQKDLGYTWGGEEKKVWLSTGKAFLRALAADLGLQESEVTSNPGGTGVNGEAILMGMWGEGNGIYVHLCREICGCGCVMHRNIRHMKDYTGGYNNWISSSEFSLGDYDGFVEDLIRQYDTLRHKEAV